MTYIVSSGTLNPTIPYHHLYLLVYCMSSNTGWFCLPLPARLLYIKRYWHVLITFTCSFTVYRVILAGSDHLYLLVYCISSDTGRFCSPSPPRVLYIERYWHVLFTFTCSFTVYRAILAGSVHLYLLVYCISSDTGWFCLPLPARVLYIAAIQHATCLCTCEFCVVSLCGCIFIFYVMCSCSLLYEYA